MNCPKCYNELDDWDIVIGVCPHCDHDFEDDSEEDDIGESEGESEELDITDFLE